MAKKPAAKSSASPASAATRFTDTKRVQDLIALMAENGLTEIELVEGAAKIVLRRGTFSNTSGAPAVHHAPHPASLHHAAPVAAPHAPSTPSAPAEDANLIAIKSPMVGTFYSAPNPESDPYVSVGTNVDEKSVVCIIEAMKVFNEIHAEVRGTVTKVLVSNGQAVEFGQPLFMVKPG
jgi:acetyl-CoA carboxylase biotin carboxyl carrier protein